MKKTIYVLLAVLVLIPTAVFAQDFSKWEDLIPYIRQLETIITDLEKQNDIETPVIKEESGLSNNFGFPSDGQLMGEIVLNIKDIYTAVDKDGKNILLIRFEFTNKTDRTVKFDREVCKKAFQNGIELQKNSHPNYRINDSTEIRPNTSIEVIYSWFIFDTENPVELELGHYDKFCPEVPYLFNLDLSLAKPWEG